MQNIKELRKMLISNIEDLKAGKMDKSLVKELNNTAGKIIATVNSEMKYQYHNGIKKEIDFMTY